MKDEDKTKEQLIDELVELRRRTEESEASESKRTGLGENQSVKIGEILVEMGHLTALQLERSLKKQEAQMLSKMLSHRHKRLGEILLESGIITEAELDSGLAEQQRILHQLKQPERSDHHKRTLRRRWWGKRRRSQTTEKEPR